MTTAGLQDYRNTRLQDYRPAEPHGYRRSRSFVILWSCCLVVLVSSSPVKAGPTTKQPASAAKPGTQTNTAKAAAVEPQIPLSAFNTPSNPKEGKDPFFPNRSINPVAPKVVPNTKVAAPIALILNGLSGTPANPLAIINNYTIAKGEEADLRAGTGRVHVRCVDIQEDKVIIEVNGERQELRLRLGMR